MVRVLSAKQEESLKKDVFCAALNGQAEKIVTSLRQLDSCLIREILHHYTETGLGRRTPLMVAAMFGHLEVVRLLVETFCVDLEQTCIFEALIGGMNALAFAICGRQWEVTKFLVEHGANVNQANNGGRSLLFTACLELSLEEVQYLVDHGALVNTADKTGCSCLMVACKKEKEDVVRYLLQKGADPNHKSSAQLTALHIAALQDASDIAESLLEYGAKLLLDNNDLSPLMEAALQESEDVVHVICQSPLATREEMIDGWELLGAELVAKDLGKAYKYLHKGMSERHRDPSEILLKPYSAPVPALGNTSESQTLEELEARRFQRDALFVDCLAIGERVLSSKGRHACRVHVSIWTHLSANGYHEEAVGVCIRALQKGGCNSRVFYHELIIIAGSMEDMVLTKSPSLFSSAGEILDFVLGRMKTDADAFQDDPPYISESLDNVYLFLRFAAIAHQAARGEEEQAHLKTLMKRFVRIGTVYFRREPTFHAVARMLWSTYGFAEEIEDIHRLPLIELLLQCGVCVNSRDAARRTPLHFMVTRKALSPSPEVRCRVMEALLEAGAHVDARDVRGRTPLDCSTMEETTALLCQQYPLPLQCLAASVIVRRMIPHRDSLPDILNGVVKLHRP